MILDYLIKLLLQKNRNIFINYTFSIIIDYTSSSLVTSISRATSIPPSREPIMLLENKFGNYYTPNKSIIQVMSKVLAELTDPQVIM